MRVAHATDHITHAVIGGKKTIDFGISNDPAFFQILSSSLYQDPTYAMIRETICNAWDAHIEAGISTPIEIILDEGYLTIKDFGPGIHDDNIGPIYGVYGASTKKLDGRQTGGFGLGCKSPFAYTDHFQVISCHAGQKTIYNMSKSSAQVEGKPSIITIATVPTQETGITVKIPINTNKPTAMLPALVRDVVFKGDIPAIFNGETLETIGLDKSEFEFVLAKNLKSSSKICVRYGNVVYPVKEHPKFSTLFKRVEALTGERYGAFLVMQAPPDSLSVTPSREALSNSDLTLQTIEGLLAKTLAAMLRNQAVTKNVREKAHAIIDGVDSPESSDLFFQNFEVERWTIPGVASMDLDPIIRTKDQFENWEIFIRLSNEGGSLKSRDWLEYQMHYLLKLAEDGFIDKGLLLTWHRTASKFVSTLKPPRNGYHRQVHRTDDYEHATDWWRRQVLAPFALKLQEVIPDFHPKHLWYTGINVTESEWERGILKPVIRIGNVTSHTRNLISLLRPTTLVISHNNETLESRYAIAKRLNQPFEFQGSILRKTYFSYEIPRKGNLAPGIIEALRQLPGIEVIDFTGRFAYEQLKYDEARLAAEARKKKKAAGIVEEKKKRRAKDEIPALSSLLSKQNSTIDTQLAHGDHVKMITAPKFMALLSRGETHRFQFRQYDNKLSYAIVKVFGDEAGFTFQRPVAERWRKNLNLPEMNPYILNEILNDLQNKPTMQTYSTMSGNRIEEYLKKKVDWHSAQAATTAYNLLLRYKDLREHIPGFMSLDDLDFYRWQIWKQIHAFCDDHNSRQRIKDAEAAIIKAPVDPKIQQFIDKLVENPLVTLLGTEFNNLMARSRNDALARQPLIDFVKSNFI